MRTMTVRYCTYDRYEKNCFLYVYIKNAEFRKPVHFDGYKTACRLLTELFDQSGLVYASASQRFSIVSISAIAIEAHSGQMP